MRTNSKFQHFFFKFFSSDFSGLVRVNGNPDSCSTKQVDANSRQMSINSINSEHVEDEKHRRDTSITEKKANIAMIAPTYCNLTRNTLRIHTAVVNEWLLFIYQ